jgi:hypothetical protein
MSFNFAAVFFALFATSSLLLPGAHGFLQAAPATHPSALFASRREVIGVGFTAAVVGALPAIAEEGSIVELQVANLDGVEGRTGTIKIQMRPDWAPRGVQRFEVQHNWSQTSINKFHTSTIVLTKCRLSMRSLSYCRS